MTLVELLVTILIIAILASLVLGIASVAGETGREAKTRTMISRLHTLLVEQYDSYKSRRIDTSAVETLTTTNPTPSQRADNRLLALRQLMKMEMPNCWSDLLNDTVEHLPPDADPSDFEELANNAWTTPFLFHPRRTEIWSAYIRHYRRMASRYQEMEAKFGANVAADTVRANQGAECLYMIITLASGDGGARSLFHENDIGDTDGDGAPEFLDGWGNPIGFVRWAPGFDSEVQLSPARLDEIRADAEARQSGSGNQAAADALAADRDPFDMYRRDVEESPNAYAGTVYEHLRDSRPAYRLVPLVYSAGRDEVADINVDSNLNTDNWTWVDPYAPAPNGMLLGTPLSSAATDNIHNHLIGAR